MTPKLEVRGVSYAYHSLDGETLALSDLSFHVEQGEFFAIVGPSGCGKSTLLSIICGLTQPDRGQILLDGKPFQRDAGAIGYMFQKDLLFNWRTIRSNAGLGLEVQNRLDKEAQKKLDAMLLSYGLGGFENAKPSELSGGMRQRAALIRTLALDPGLLLLDEPFSALDYQTRLAVCDDISSLIRRTGKTAVLVTHDLSEAISTADHILVLSARPGRVKALIPISFEDGCSQPLIRRNRPEFSAYFNQVWKELRS